MDKCWIYILELEENKYYVGKTSNPAFRLENHFSGNGSVWTQIYKPIKLIELIENCDDYDEDKYTIKYMAEFGLINVRGGSFCSKDLTDAEILVLNKMICSVLNKCFKCGKEGHLAKECGKTKIVMYQGLVTIKYSPYQGKFLMDENNILYKIELQKGLVKFSIGSWVHGYSINPKEEGLKYSERYENAYPEVCDEELWFSVMNPPEGQGELYKKWKEDHKLEMLAGKGGGRSPKNEQNRLEMLEARKKDEENNLKKVKGF